MHRGQLRRRPCQPPVAGIPPSEDPGGPAPLPIVHPALGKVQIPIDQGTAPLGGIGGEHPDPAVIDYPRRAGLLPRHTGRRYRLFLMNPMSSIYADVSIDRPMSSTELCRGLGGLEVNAQVNRVCSPEKVCP